ncbi:Non-hemolytic phospholipase C precursor [Streptomyces jeddahensis]|uniref:Non-hemolytic phospholipase C n=1 Tax=Streptomyces jeddahensis TaxID=1716141 RepID=A0A177I2K3_9ACTN|nr:Non-hemolytic phospholipase C precursor [Streptomyces jeddahensis]
MRTFKGSVKAAGAEVTARHDASTGGLKLTLTNTGTTAVTLTLTNAYGGRPRTVTVRAGDTVAHTVDLRASKRWYDLTVTSDSDPAFLRRFAGHVETGEPGVSDPAIITD